MPRYAYTCDACNRDFEVSHGMFFEQENCVGCKRSGFLRKRPEFRLNKSIPKSSSKPGRIVDNFIEEAKKELKDQKTDAQKETKK